MVPLGYVPASKPVYPHTALKDFVFAGFNPMCIVGYATGKMDVSPRQNDIFHNLQWCERMKGD